MTRIWPADVGGEYGDGTEGGGGGGGDQLITHAVATDEGSC